MERLINSETPKDLNIRYEKQLEGRVFRDYPLIRGLYDENFLKFGNRKIKTASFHIYSPDREMVKGMFDMILKVAADASDCAHCKHGAEKHGRDFYRALEILEQSNLDGTLSIEKNVFSGDAAEGKPVIYGYSLLAPAIKRKDSKYRARANLLSMQTVAENTARTNRNWGNCSNVSDSYKGLATTKITTAYLDIIWDKNSNFWRNHGSK